MLFVIFSKSHLGGAKMVKMSVDEIVTLKGLVLVSCTKMSGDKLRDLIRRFFEERKSYRSLSKEEIILWGIFEDILGKTKKGRFLQNNPGESFDRKVRVMAKRGCCLREDFSLKKKLSFVHDALKY